MRIQHTHRRFLRSMIFATEGAENPEGRGVGGNGRWGAKDFHSHSPSTPHLPSFSMSSVLSVLKQTEARARGVEPRPTVLEAVCSPRSVTRKFLLPLFSVPSVSPW